MTTADPSAVSRSKAASRGGLGSAETHTAFYDEDVQDVSTEARNLLEQYSRYSTDEVLPRVLKLRDVAFAQHHYACIGQMRFLLYNLPLLPFYERVTARLRSGATFMDAGCCFGQELRYLCHTQRIASSQLFGFDFEELFIDLGFELFRDRDRMSNHLVKGDVLASADDPREQELFRFDGAIDIVFCSSFLHIWPWKEMVIAAKRLVQLTKGREHAVICGKQLASQNAGHYAMPNSHGQNYRHNEQSMREFWKQVGQETDTEWEVDTGLYSGIELEKNRTHAWSDPNQAMIWFYATRK